MIRICLLLWCLIVSCAQAETLHVMGAGSLESAFTDLLARFPAGPDTVGSPEFGPSGLMRGKIESGAEVDLFASADLDNARRLALGHPERELMLFTRNRLCAIARERIGLTSANMLERLLDPAVRIATSTPHADPGGDYAWAVFARADQVKPGARAVLEGKAQKLVGGGDATPLLVPGRGAVEGVFLADRADVMLGYCSGGPDVTRAVPGLSVVALPPDLTVGPAYGMVLLTQKSVTYRFAAFVMSEAGQAVLLAHGFDPVAWPGSTERTPPLVVEWPGHAPAFLTRDRLAELKQLAVVFPGEHGGADQHWSGPSLWDALVASGAVAAADARSHSAHVVRVTGSDGYFVMLSLGELSPEFAARTVVLGVRLNDAEPPGGLPRVVVPGEKRGGRSVRDVVRLDIQ